MPAKASACASLFWYKCLVVMECFWDSTGLAFRMQFASFDYWCAVFLTVWTDLFLIQASIEDRDKMTHHSAPTPFCSRSMCTLRETNYWHEMWPTQLDLSQPPKIGWSRSHNMTIKILWYVDLLSFRPNSLTWSTNLKSITLGCSRATPLST